MFTRRQFLGTSLCVGVGLSTRKLFALEHKLTSKLFKATCYYPKPLVALQKGGSKLTVHTENGPWVLRVDSNELRLAKIEASAMVDLSKLQPFLGKVGIAYYSGKWHCHSYAPYGVGDRLNPLVPGRDFANNHMAFGTRLEIGAPKKLEKLIRPVMYRGCKFGVGKPANRIDLFLAAPNDYYGPVRAIVRKPWACVSSAPVRGAQQCLQILGLVGMDGKKIDDDNVWGDNTRHALLTALGQHPNHFPFGTPRYRVPWDSEIYYQIREIAKAKKNA